MFVRYAWAGVLGALLLIAAGCGGEQSGGGGSQTMSYKDMKSMVIDILKTEDAQKALQESATSASGGSTGLQALSVQGQEQVRLAVKDVLVSPDYNKVIEKLMTDPKFAGEFAKAVNKQNKQIHKELMKDPTYQQDLIQVMKNPEMDKVILDVMQSPQFRKQIVTVMQQSIQSPIIKLQMYELLQKAVHEELKPTQGASGGGGGQGGGGEGGGSGGGGGGGGGG